MKLDAYAQRELHCALENLDVRYGVTVLVTVCCRCGQVLRSRDGDGVSGLSHGLCTPCNDLQLAEIRRMSEGRKA